MFCLFLFFSLYLINSPMGMTKLWADASLILGYWHQRMPGALRDAPNSSSHQMALSLQLLLAGGGHPHWPPPVSWAGRSATVKPQMSPASQPAPPPLMSGASPLPWGLGKRRGDGLPSSFGWHPQSTRGSHLEPLQTAGHHWTL